MALLPPPPPPPPWATKFTPFAPLFVEGEPSGVEMLTDSCAGPWALFATLTLIVMMARPLVRPGIENELVQVIVGPDALQVQLPLTEADET